MNKKILETNQQPWKLRTREGNIRTFLFPTPFPPPVIYAESGNFSDKDFARALNYLKHCKWLP